MNKAGFTEKTEDVISCIEIIFELRGEETKINAQDRIGRTPLAIAAFHGNFFIVQYLLQKLADQTIKDMEELSPAQLAISNNHSQVLEVLLENNSAIVA